MEITCSPDENIFDDGDWELIETLVRVFSSILHIKGHVMVMNDEQWLEYMADGMSVIEKKKYAKDMQFNFGEATNDINAIWINPRIVKRSYAQLVDTVFHELLHIKHPDKDEETIRSMEVDMVGRYDIKKKKLWCYE